MYITKKNANTRLIPFRTCLPFLLMTCVAIAAGSIDIYLPALPELAKLFNATDNVLRASIMISPLVSAFAGLIYGKMSDMYGRRIIVLICLFIFSIGSTWCGFSDSALEFFIARFTQAVGSTGMGLITVTILSDKFKGITLARYLGYFGILYPIAFAIAPNVGAFIMLYVSWQGMFFFLTLLSVTLLIVMFFILPETMQEDPEKNVGVKNYPTLPGKEFFKTIFDLAKNKKVFRNMALTNALSVAINQIFITNAPFIFEIDFGYSRMEYANLLLIPHITNILGCAVYSFLLKFYSPKSCLNIGRAFLFLFIITVIISLSWNFKPGVTLIIAIQCLCSFGIGFLITTSMGFAIFDLETAKGVGTGMVQFTRNIVSSAIVMISGYFCHGCASYVLIAMSVCAMAMLFLVFSCYSCLKDVA